MSMMNGETTAPDPNEIELVKFVKQAYGNRLHTLERLREFKDAYLVSRAKDEDGEYPDTQTYEAWVMHFDAWIQLRVINRYV